MQYAIKEEGKFKYIETGKGEETLLLLHGLFGALSNFDGIVKEFGDRYNVVIPILPMFEMPLIKVSVGGLMKHITLFIEEKGFTKMHLLGNSLGGHIALLYALENPDKVASVSLTGSSGLFENSLGSTFPKRGDYKFVKEKTEATFYDPEMASKELIDEVFEIFKSREKTIRIISVAKSAIRHNLEDRLQHLEAPTLLVWGQQDNVTPPFVAEKFHELIPNSTLHFIDKCGHAPMMERPDAFNEKLNAFLKEVSAANAIS